jgi:putative tryptophan/tyrosine transport system substrate-binding protein
VNQFTERRPGLGYAHTGDGGFMCKLVFALLMGVLAPCLAAAQQPGKVYRFAGVGAGPPSCEFPPSDIAKGTPWDGRPFHRNEVVLRLALREFGLVDGQNVVFERRCIQSSAQLEGIAAELATRNLYAVLGWGTTVTQALKHALRVPIIFVGGPDPVRDGLVESLARPGGHVTGVSSQMADLTEKRNEVFRELLPQAKTLAFMYARAEEGLAYVPNRPAVPERFGFEVRRFPVDGWGDIEAAFLTMRGHRPDLLSVAASSVLIDFERVFQRATAEGLPAVCGNVYYVPLGCLMSYSINNDHMIAIAGRMLSKVLLGANPALMPVEQGTKFELWVNLKTANALGITIAPSLLARADRVIE